MKNIIALITLLASASMAGAQINFDQGADVAAFRAQAAAVEVNVPEAKTPVMIDMTRDCKKFTFSANDPLTSPEIQLTSMKTFEDCQNMGGPVGQICTPYSNYYRANAKLVITAPRELKPGQKEIFEVCLWGSFLELKPVSTIYKYSVRQLLNTFELTPSAPAAAPAGKTVQQDACSLVMDTDYSCVYQCKNGSYISKPSPFGHPPFPGMGFPFHGCRPSVPNTPLITVLN